MSDKKYANLDWCHMFRDSLFEGGRNKRIGSDAIHVYMAIKCFGGFSDGINDQRIADISETTGISERQVKYAINTLAKEGMLERRKEGRKNTYVVKEQFIAVGEDGKSESISFPYSRATAGEFQKAVASYLKTGQMPTNTTINIEKLVIQIANNQVNVDGSLVTGLDLDAVKDPKLREQLANAIEHQRRRK